MSHQSCEEEEAEWANGRCWVRCRRGDSGGEAGTQETGVGGGLDSGGSEIGVGTGDVGRNGE